MSRHVQQAVMDVQVGVSCEGLSIAKLGNFLIPLPPLAEQSRIVTRVEELMRLCDALEARGQLEAAQHAQLVSTLLATLTDSATPEALTENWQRLSPSTSTLCSTAPKPWTPWSKPSCNWPCGQLVPRTPPTNPASELLKHIRSEKDRLIAAGQIKRDRAAGADHGR
ncbi:MAG: restriction endonuclease subunit S [Betaproteobacteria bacterium]|nr:restriction endonuclease subunit S [Betaproteobacteria bacterium]